MLEVKIIPLSGYEDLPLPQKASAGASGYDLYAAIERTMTLKPGERLLVPAGVCIEIPQGYEAQIRPRSGLALRHGITLLNTPGTIDADYRGEIGVIIIHQGQEPFDIHRGDRIAQMVFSRVEEVHWFTAETLSPTERGGGGFGHTGV